MAKSTVLYKTGVFATELASFLETLVLAIWCQMYFLGAESPIQLQHLQWMRWFATECERVLMDLNAGSATSAEVSANPSNSDP